MVTTVATNVLIALASAGVGTGLGTAIEKASMRNSILEALREKGIPIPDIPNGKEQAISAIQDALTRITDPTAIAILEGLLKKLI